jgi:hypothetical protein
VEVCGFLCLCFLLATASLFPSFSSIVSGVTARLLTCRPKNDYDNAMQINS